MTTQMKRDKIYAAGVSHDTAPLAVRERFSLSGERLRSALHTAGTFSSECVIVSTCNRFEVYALAGDAGDEAHLLSLLDEVFGESSTELRPYTYSFVDEAAIGHLFRVASGVDSLVLGEVQILGQVQRAWQTAHQVGTAGPVLSQLFHKGVALGKRVHSETAISRQPASVSYAAVMLARQIFGAHLAERRALVIGTGDVGEGVARCLYEHGVNATVVAHRQIERAHSVARRYHADTATWEDLPRCLAEADIVISSTAAPHYVLQRQHIEEAISARPGRPLYLIDLAVPRDIDPAAGDLAHVHLHNIDDLHSVVHTTMQERRSALPEIEAMIELEVVRFAEWLRARSTAPMIQQLHAQAEAITRRELEWANAKMPDLTERQRRVIEAMAQRMVGKLLHGPIQWLKAQASEPEFAQRRSDADNPANREPDYGMSSLTAKELAELFYRSTGTSDAEETE